ncbi:hypothetical protein ACH5RR_021798 [Cinchona calisaya]|uniref:Uncharacterized protein n=1 Tax=Cinchona calisaya TaxID=153742 RepID=A0ABD2ZIB7_9GENT
MIYALAGLPLEYESFVMTVTANNALHLFADLRNKLLQQEQRLRQLQLPSATSTTCFVSVFTNSNRGRDQGSRGQELLFSCLQSVSLLCIPLLLAMQV